MIKYRTYKNLIRKLSWKIAKEYKYDYEELFSEACFIFVKIQKNYLSKKASFSTYLYKNIYFGLKDYVKKNMQRTESYDEYMERIENSGIVMKNKLYEDMSRVESIIEFYDNAVNELSNNAQQILKVILRPEPNRIPRYHSVQKYFKYFLGWKNKQIESAWDEIKNWWKNYQPSKVYY